MIGVAGVDKDLLVLFVPVIYLILNRLTEPDCASEPCYTREASGGQK